MTNSVALLGVKGGPAIRTGSMMPTSMLLTLDGHEIVVDCGLGVTRGLVDQDFALKDLRTIFVTHLHSDHYLELGPLLHTAWCAGLATEVDVYGPAGLHAYWVNFCEAMRFDIDLRQRDEGRPDLEALVKVHVVSTESEIALAGLSVTAMRTEHPPIQDCFAYRFQGAEQSVVFGSDTAYLPRLTTFAKNADLLIHEAMLADAVDALVARVGNGDERLKKHLLRSHTMAEDAAKIATEAGVSALALNHLIPSDDPDYVDADWERAVRTHWDGPLYIGHDGMKISLE